MTPPRTKDSRFLRVQDVRQRVAGKDPLALQRCALVLILRFGSRLLSEYKELFKAPVSSFTASYSQKNDQPGEHRLKENRAYNLPEHHTRGLLSESDHDYHLMGKAKGGKDEPLPDDDTADH